MEVNNENRTAIMDMDLVEATHDDVYAPTAINTCIQTAGNLDSDERGDLWRLPMSYSARKKENPHIARYPLYRKLCMTITQNWNSWDAKEWVPEELLKTTPYSLTLLTQIASLATNTRGQRPEALRMIREKFDQRLSSAHIQQSVLHQTSAGQAHTEPEFIERLDGVLRQDLLRVNESFQRIKKERRLLERYNRQQTRMQARKEAENVAHAKVQQQTRRGEARVSSVELVGVEWSANGANERAVAISTPSSERRDRKQRLRRSGYTAKPQPRTKDELASSFRLDDLDREWDSESDEDVNEYNDPGFVLANPDIEPISVSTLKGKKKKKFRTLHAQKDRAASEDVKKLDIAMEVSEASESDTPPRTAAQRKELSRRQVKDVLADVAARSIQLPSERIDLSLVGKLEKSSDQKQISSMLDGLDAIAMDLDKKDRLGHKQ